MSFADARALPDGHVIEGDLCIIGAGAAGLAIARSFFGSSQRVVLLESGGLSGDPETQSLYRGASVGQAHAPLHEARLRYFGGSTNHWTAHVRALDPIDFEIRAWIPHSGWPFARAELDPFYARAGRLLGLPASAFDVTRWQQVAGRRPLPFRDHRVESCLRVIVGEEHRRLGAILRDDLDRSANVAAYLYANVTRFELSEGGARVTGLRVATLSGRRLLARARRYVLATGGIENARLLLLSEIGGRDPSKSLVGRYYANHPEGGPVGWLQLAPRYGAGFYAIGVDADQRRVWPFLRISDALQRESGVPNGQILLAVRPIQAHAASAPTVALASHHPTGEDPLAAELPDPAFVLASEPVPRPPRGARKPLHFRVLPEPVPNPESRVSLGDSLDALGQRRVVLDWRLTETDSAGLRRTLEVLAREVGASGLGRVRIQLPAHGLRRASALGSHHHMGTTRMHRDPGGGVVDENCRVHGTENLYVAGSSVFPTYGCVNPTYTILALAFRLAEHLRSLSRSSR